MQGDGCAPFLAAAAQRFLLQHLTRCSSRTDAGLATLGDKARARELSRGIVVGIADHVRDDRVIRDDLGRKDRECNHQIGDEESTRGSDEIRKCALPARPPVHPDAFLRRAAKAPSAPCR
jgi:hypothetical protein